MCQSKRNTEFCQSPDKLKDKPGECTPEQIAECHGKPEEHPAPEKCQ